MRRFLVLVIFASLAAHCQDKKGGAGYINTFGLGASAVSRSVEDKLRDFVNIKDFGAVCNGTDQNTAVQAAITAGATTIYIPSGCKWIPPSNTINGGVTYIGESWGSTTGGGSIIESANPSTEVLKIGPLARLFTVNTHEAYCVTYIPPLKADKYCPVASLESMDDAATYDVGHMPFDTMKIAGSSGGDGDRTAYTVGVYAVGSGYYCGAAPGSTGYCFHSQPQSSGSGIKIDLIGTAHGIDIGDLTGASGAGSPIYIDQSVKTNNNLMSLNQHANAFTGNVLSSNMAYSGGTFTGNYWTFWNAGAEKSRLASNGAVTFASSGEFGGSINADGYNRNMTAAGNMLLINNAYYDGGWKRYAAGFPQMINFSSGGDLTLSVADTGIKDSAITWTSSIFYSWGGVTIPAGLTLSGAVTGATNLPTLTANSFFNNDIQVGWKDSVGTNIPALWLDGSNNFHVGLQAVPASAGDMFFYARGDDAFKLTKPTANFYLEPIDDYLVHLGTVSKRFEVLNTMFVQVYSNVATGRAARLDLQTGDEANTLSLLAAKVGGGTYNIYFPAAPPGTANKILATTAATSNPLAWVDLPTGTIGGSGTAGTLPKFSAASTLADSILTESGTLLAVSAGAGTVNANIFSHNVATAGGLALWNNVYYDSGWKRFAAGYPQMIGLDVAGGLSLNVAATGAKDSAITWLTSSFAATGDWTIPGGLAMTGALTGATNLAGSNSVLAAACSAQLALTTSYQDVAGATLALDRVGTWLVIGSIVANRGLDDTLIVGRLDVDGSPVARLAKLGGTAAVPGMTSISQTWVVTIASQPKTIKLQVVKVGTGASTIEPDDTTLTAAWIN